MEYPEMIKAFAKLEGLKLDIRSWGGVDLIFLVGNDAYNPVADLSVNCAARDKYEVEVTYAPVSYSFVSIGKTAVRFFGAHEKPQAVIECILKSEGLWVA